MRIKLEIFKGKLFIVKFKSRPIVYIGTLLPFALLLSACGGEVDTSGLEAKVRPTSAQSDLTVESEGEDPTVVGSDEEAPDVEETVETEAPTPTRSGDYQIPEWANDVVEVGDLLQTYRNDVLEMEIYQVATGEAASDSIWSHPDTGEAILKKGDPVVALNLIATNISDTEVLMSTSFIMTSMSYDSSDILQGAMIDYNSAWITELGLNLDAFSEFRSPGVFPLAPGESFAFAQIYEYHPEAVTMNLDFTPVDEEGKLDFDSPLHDRGEVNFVLN